jgi:hypothetical protein
MAEHARPQVSIFMFGLQARTSPKRILAKWSLPSIDNAIEQRMGYLSTFLRLGLPCLGSEP